eukprot:9500836-Pyramimonas_sp.AAC.1
MFRGPTGSSTEGPSATTRMRHARPFWHITDTFRGPRGLHRRRQWLRSHAPTARIRHTSHTFRVPIASSTDRPN